MNYEIRSEEQEAKENVKRVSVDLEPNEGNLDPLPNKMEAKDALTSSELDSQESMAGLKNENDGKVKDSDDPCPDCPQDIEPVESLDLPGVVNSSKNPADFYMDKSVTECEPELVVVYKESSDNVIKDICVDEGIPAEEKILLENKNEEAAYKFSSSEDHKSEKLSKENLAVDAPFPVFIDLPAITEESDKFSTNPSKLEDLMLNDDDDETRKLANDVDKEMLLAGYKVLLQDLDEEQSMPLIEEGNKAEQNYSQVSCEPELPSKPKESEDKAEEAVSKSSAKAEEESNGNVSDAGTPENCGVTSQFDPPFAAASTKEESDRVGEPKHDGARSSSESVDVKGEPKHNDDRNSSESGRHSLGETSFSAVGRVSSRITCLDPVPYSGSISLRSDSSTTSTRSFAFPVLQSEWSSSPVRMAKADRRHCRKKRGWRQGLLCCRF
ncbi:uncharacterized protein LOC114758617 isoform X2 [Neltuma alba]|uniref:uncharacterized protein LOC114754294 isoform X2 n=1 Tax=Neltuma alba TaxID=207710 RepID=UPI0010A3C492|nr:uncharacterized protein LOC114754294 isoform X2 [Prosopis alba]XP_028803515.1 uncharacterized protein LOC114758617 isoform X2 [Prosopis alba]